VQDRFKVLPTIRIGENLLAKVIAAQPTLAIQAIQPKSRNDFRQRRLARLDQFPGELIGIDNGYSLPSVSITGIPCRAKRWPTSDLPLPIPPVRPMTNTI